MPLWSVVWLVDGYYGNLIGSADFIIIGVKWCRLNFNIFSVHFQQINPNAILSARACSSQFITSLVAFCKLNSLPQGCNSPQENMPDKTTIPRHSNIMNNIVNLFTKCCLTVFRKWSTKRLLKEVLLTTVILNLVELHINSENKTDCFFKPYFWEQ